MAVYSSVPNRSDQIITDTLKEENYDQDSVTSKIVSCKATSNSQQILSAEKNVKPPNHENYVNRRQLATDNTPTTLAKHQAVSPMSSASLSEETEHQNVSPIRHRKKRTFHLPVRSITPTVSTRRLRHSAYGAPSNPPFSASHNLEGKLFFYTSTDSECGSPTSLHNILEQNTSTLAGDLISSTKSYASPREKFRLGSLKNVLRSSGSVRKGNYRKEKANSVQLKNASIEFPDLSAWTLAYVSDDLRGHSVEFEVKRIFRYDEYLNDLLSETNSSHPDYKGLSKATDEVKNMLEERCEECDGSEVDSRTDGLEYRIPDDGDQIPDPDECQSKQKPLSFRRRTAPNAILLRTLASTTFRSTSIYNWSHGNQGRKESDSLNVIKQISDTNRLFIMEGPVQLSTGLLIQERYIFLFTDILLIAKQKSSTTFKLKGRVLLCDVWLSSVDEDNVTAELSLPMERTLALGWPMCNFLATFSDVDTKDRWTAKLMEYVLEAKLRMEIKELSLNVTLLDESKEEENATEYNLLVCTGKDNSAYLLNGHELPFSIKASQLRELANENNMTMSELIATVGEDPPNLKCDFIVKLKKKSDNRNMDEDAPKLSKKAKKQLFTFFKRGVKEDIFHHGSYKRDTRATGQVFGRPLSSVFDNENNLDRGVLEVMRALLRKGPVCHGIFRRSPNSKERRQLDEYLDQGKPVPDHFHASVYASVLKEFLRELPDSLFVNDFQHDWIAIGKLDNHQDKILKTKQLLTCLPPVNVVVMRYVVCLLHHIAENHLYNKMDANNLAICITPSLCFIQETEDVGAVASVVKLLIEQCEDIFGTDTLHLLGTPPALTIECDGRQLADRMDNSPDLDNRSKNVPVKTSESGTDSESVHSLLSIPDSGGSNTRCNHSSMDSLVDRRLYSRDGDDDDGGQEDEPYLGSQHVPFSSSNLSRDSGLTLSDIQLYDEDSVDGKTSIGSPVHSSESCGNGQHVTCPVPPPRRKSQRASASNVAERETILPDSDDILSLAAQTGIGSLPDLNPLSSVAICAASDEISAEPNEDVHSYESNRRLGVLAKSDNGFHTSSDNEMSLTSPIESSDAALSSHDDVDAALSSHDDVDAALSSHDDVDSSQILPHTTFVSSGNTDISDGDMLTVLTHQIKYNDDDRISPWLQSTDNSLPSRTARFSYSLNMNHGPLGRKKEDAVGRKTSMIVRAHSVDTPCLLLNADVDQMDFSSDPIEKMKGVGLHHYSSADRQRHPEVSIKSPVYKCFDECKPTLSNDNFDITTLENDEGVQQTSCDFLESRYMHEPSGLTKSTYLLDSPDLLEASYVMKSFALESSLPEASDQPEASRPPMSSSLMHASHPMESSDVPELCNFQICGDMQKCIDLPESHNECRSSYPQKFCDLSETPSLSALCNLPHSSNLSNKDTQAASAVIIHEQAINTECDLSKQSLSTPHVNQKFNQDDFQQNDNLNNSEKNSACVIDKCGREILQEHGQDISISWKWNASTERNDAFAQILPDPMLPMNCGDVGSGNDSLLISNNATHACHPYTVQSIVTHPTSSKVTPNQISSNTTPHHASSNTTPHPVSSNTTRHHTSSNTTRHHTSSNTTPHHTSSNTTRHHTSSNTTHHHSSSSTTSNRTPSNTIPYQTSSNAADAMWNIVDKVPSAPSTQSLLSAGRKDANSVSVGMLLGITSATSHSSAQKYITIPGANGFHKKTPTYETASYRKRHNGKSNPLEVIAQRVKEQKAKCLYKESIQKYLCQFDQTGYTETSRVTPWPAILSPNSVLSNDCSKVSCSDTVLTDKESWSQCSANGSSPSDNDKYITVYGQEPCSQGGGKYKKSQDSRRTVGNVPVTCTSQKSPIILNHSNFCPRSSGEDYVNVSNDDSFSADLERKPVDVHKDLPENTSPLCCKSPQHVGHSVIQNKQLRWNSDCDLTSSLHSVNISSGFGGGSNIQKIELSDRIKFFQKHCSEPNVLSFQGSTAVPFTKLNRPQNKSSNGETTTSTCPVMFCAASEGDDIKKTPAIGVSKNDQSPLPVELTNSGISDILPDVRLKSCSILNNVLAKSSPSHTASVSPFIGGSEANCRQNSSCSSHANAQCKKSVPQAIATSSVGGGLSTHDEQTSQPSSHLSTIISAVTSSGTTRGTSVSNIPSSPPSSDCNSGQSNVGCVSGKLCWSVQDLRKLYNTDNNSS